MPTGVALAVPALARGAATVTLTAPAGERVRLGLYDLRGRALGVVYDGAATGAAQTFTLGAEARAAGAVIVRAEAASGHLARRVTFVR